MERIILLALIIVLAGCTSLGTSDGSSPVPETEVAQETTIPESSTSLSPPNETKSEYSHLESVLTGLLSASNKTAYANAHGLEIQNESVKVILELEQNRSVPTEFDVAVISQYRTDVEAFVPVRNLAALSEHSNVTFVRAPRRVETSGI